MKYLYYTLGLGFLFLLFQPNWIYQRKLKEKKLSTNSSYNIPSSQIRTPNIAGEYQSSDYYLKLDSGQVYTFLYQNQKTGKQIRGNWELSRNNSIQHIVLQIPTQNKLGYREQKLEITAHGLEDKHNNQIYQRLKVIDENKLLVIRD